MRAGIVKPKPECRHCGAPLASSFARCRRCGKRSWTFLLPTWLRQH